MNNLFKVLLKGELEGKLSTFTQLICIFRILEPTELYSLVLEPAQTTWYFLERKNVEFRVDAYVPIKS